MRYVLTTMRLTRADLRLEGTPSCTKLVGGPRTPLLVDQFVPSYIFVRIEV